MQKCGYYSGIPGFLQVYPKIPGILPISHSTLLSLVIRFRPDFAAKKCTRTRFHGSFGVSVEAGGIPYHFLISAGLGKGV